MKIQLQQPYPLLAPAPAAVISVGSNQSGDNLITLSWIGVACSEPPQISIGVRRTGRHSYNILLENAEFAVNIPHHSQEKQVSICGTLHGDKVDKWQETGLTKQESKIISVPIIKEFPVNLECVIRHRVELGSHDLFIGEVVTTHIDDSILKDGVIDIAQFSPLSYIPKVSRYFHLDCSGNQS